MTTLVHISDIHFGDASPDKLRAASVAISEIGPACVIVTGDVTQEGKRDEFALAAAWFETIKAPIIGCPGNHDTPMFNLALRLFDPFSRFDRLGLLSSWQSGDASVHIETANSARGLQWRMDWSQGDYAQANVIEALGRLSRSRARHKILALHHPPETPRGAGVTSEPRGVDVFARHLTETKPDVLLCGHLHAAFDVTGPLMCGLRVMTVPSLASSRERGFGSGFGVLRLGSNDPIITRTIWRYQEGSFHEVTEPSKGTVDVAG